MVQGAALHWVGEEDLMWALRLAWPKTGPTA